MKKTLKTLAIVIVAFSAGEFVTGWRMQPEPMDLKEYTKMYLRAQKQGYRDGKEYGQHLANGTDLGRVEFVDLARRRYN